LQRRPAFGTWPFYSSFPKGPHISKTFNCVKYREMRLFYMSLVRPPGGSRTHKDDVNTCDAVTPVPALLLLGEDRFSLGRSLGVSTASCGKFLGFRLW